MSVLFLPSNHSHQTRNAIISAVFLSLIDENFANSGLVRVSLSSSKFPEVRYLFCWTGSESNECSTKWMCMCVNEWKESSASREKSAPFVGSSSLVNRLRGTADSYTYIQTVFILWWWCLSRHEIFMFQLNSKRVQSRENLEEGGWTLGCELFVSSKSYSFHEDLLVKDM